MQRASDIIALIPDVKPKVAMRVLKEAILDKKHGYEGLSKEDQRMAFRDDYVKKISPVGGRILLELFEEGLILQKTRGASRDTLELRAYARKEDEYRQEVREAAERKAAYQQRIKEIASNPDCALPEEITPDLIDKVFLEKFGYGEFGELQIGGLSCHKDMTSKMRSNSGKSFVSRGNVYCYWYDETGNRRGQVPVEPHRNRRNDPDRNWGLGRE